MSARQRIYGAVTVAACAVACAMACALPASSLASAREQSIMMDDNHVVYATPATAIRTLEAMATIGVDRVKVSVNWKNISPDGNAFHRPHFNASNPAAYPSGAWAQYDLIVRAAQALGMGVYFQLTPPAPNWAVSSSPTTQGHAWSHYPSLRYYGQFVTAVGRRYSGSYVPPKPDPPTPARTLLGIPIPGLYRKVNPPASDPIPRVAYWGIWNEPNEAAWLNPQFRFAGGQMILTAPALYRGLVYAAWKALSRTGHASDTVLLGETASYGWIKPVEFVTALYCVSPSIRPLTGQAAADERCPRSGNVAAFARGNPGLFAASGYAHHPYSFDQPPSWTPPLPNEVTLQNLGWLERTLDRIFRLYGHPRPGGVPMYLSEWGYKSNPPNPYVKTSLDQQAIWMNEGEYMSFLDPHVRSLAQFLLYDDKPRSQYAHGSRPYWGTFQTGLMFAGGRRKPAFYTFRIPLWVPSQHPGHRVMIWGELRPADHHATQYAVVEFKRRLSRPWRTLTALQTDSPEGFFVNHITIPSAGYLRVAWLAPSGRVFYSRRVRIY